MTCFVGRVAFPWGIKRAGFSTALAVDNWVASQQTYTKNLSGVPFLLADIEQLTATNLLSAAGMDMDEEPTLVVGGPPCQGFSSAGKRKARDPRNTLVGTFARLVADLRPSFFLFENVEGFLSAGRGSAVFALLDTVLEAGYRVHLRKINAANYGVPQLRKRVIAVGALGISPAFPPATHTAYGAPGAHLAGKYLPHAPTLHEAIRDLEDDSTPYECHNRELLEGIDLERCLVLRPRVKLCVTFLSVCNMRVIRGVQIEEYAMVCQLTDEAGHQLVFEG